MHRACSSTFTTGATTTSSPRTDRDFSRWPIRRSSDRDLAYGRKVYPAIRKGAQFIVNDHKTNNKYGLIRSSIPYDAPMLTGYHTCHNLFALLALRTSIRAARLLGETEDAEAWTAAEATYRQAILKAIDDVDRQEGYIRSGLYDWTPGRVQGNGPRQRLSQSGLGKQPAGLPDGTARAR